MLKNPKKMDKGLPNGNPLLAPEEQFWFF